MTFLGFLIVLLIGAGIGYFFANMRGGAADTDRNGERRSNRNMIRQRPTSSHAFMAETGEIGSEDGQTQGQSLQDQGPVKPAYSSASVFLQNKDQVDRNQANMSQSQGLQSQGLQSQPVKTASSSASVFEQSGSQGQGQSQNQSQALQSQPAKTASSSASVFEQSGNQGQSLSSQNTYTTGGTQQNVGTNDQSAGDEQTSGTSGSDSQLLQ